MSGKRELFMLNEKEKLLIKYMQGDMVLTKRPFRYLADYIGADEDEVIDIIRRLKEQTIIRKVGAILRHQKAGLTENAMVVWAVPDEECERVGAMLAAYRNITHCYERTPPLEGKYNLYTMIHRSEKGVEKFVKKISLAVGIEDFLILKSKEEFKKSSMEYY
jgi:DNA-binding Lrp family transcriptional regulator